MAMEGMAPKSQKHESTATLMLFCWIFFCANQIVEDDDEEEKIFPPDPRIGKR
jgi:hypothetical protein